MVLIGNGLLMVAVLTFVAVMLLVEGLYLLWRSGHGREARKVRSRLDALTSIGDPEMRARLVKEADAFEKLLLRLPRAEQLRMLLQQSGLGISLGGLGVLTLAGAGVALLLSSTVLRVVWLADLAVGTTGALAPFAYVLYRRAQRLAKLEQQLPEALDLIGRGLRAGHAFSSTLKMAGEELQEPVGGEFRLVHEEINFGVSMEQALTNLATRVPSTDVRFFVVAVLIQRESGGNLTEILGNLSMLIRDRLKLHARVRVLSSEGRLSAWILVAMPFVLAGAITAMNRDFMQVLWTDPLGISLVKGMLGLMAVGIVILRQIVRIRY
jgi:tight adherence protein B